MAGIVGAGIKIGGQIVKAAFGKETAKKAVAVSTKNAAKKAAKKAAVKANARGLKAAQGKSLAPKKYKADSEGRKQVKRFAAPLEKFNGKKTSMRMGAQAVDAGRSSLKIKAAPKNRNK
jgi:hypothetical protein